MKFISIRFVFLLLTFFMTSYEAHSQNAAYSQDAAEYPIIRGIRYRGYIRCGVDVSTNAYAYTPDAGKTWKGFDADICKALSIGVFGFPDRLKMVPITEENRYEYLRDEKIDVLLGATPFLPSSDTLDKIIFAAPLFIQEQGFVGHFKKDAKSMEDYKRSRVCVRKNTSILDNLVFYNRIYQLGFRIFPVESFSQAREYLFLKHCDLYADYQAILKSKEIRQFPKGLDLVVLPETIAYESAGIAVKDTDPKWFKMVRWIINSLIFAETKDVTKNKAEILEKSQDPQIQNVLGINPNLGTRLGLAPKWGLNIIKEVGNYGEIFERNLGKSSDFDFPRDLNAPVANGGFLWTPSFN